jgi:hypothetical protein
MISERTSRDSVAGARGRPSQHRDRTCNRRFRFRWEVGGSGLEPPALARDDTEASALTTVLRLLPQA